MARVRHLVTPPGKDPVEFFAPEDASDAQLQILANRALKKQYPGESFVTPVLDQATREAIASRSKRMLTQDEILARQGELTSRDASWRERDIEGLTGLLQGVGFSDMAREKAGRFVNDVYDWTPVGSAEAANEAFVDAGGGRYLDAAGNAVLAGLDLVPEVGQAAGTGASALAMFLGRNAKTANLDFLRKAEQMASQGADRRQIWDETGWFQGADGQWRFEISDEGLKVKDPMSGQQGANAAAKAKARELGYKSPNDIPWTKFDDVEAVRRAGTQGWNDVINGVPLGDVISHPELEAAYPERFASMTARPMSKLETKGGSVGNYNPSTGQIRWKTTGRKGEEKRSTVAHELMHGVVQDPEGFAGGSLVGRAGSVEAGPYYKSAVRTRDHILRLLDDPNVSEISKIQLRRNLREAEKKIGEAAQYEGYRRVAGEVEARNVQSRLNMTPEERRATPPWETQDIPDEDQFVVFRGEGAQGSQLPPKDVFAATSGRKTALGTEFEGAGSYEDALALATAGVHLRPDARGFLMGSPDIKANQSALDAWRSNTDQLMASANQEGLGWYQRGRDIIDEISDTPEMASLFARGGAVYSPQASPTSETNFWLRHHNRRVLTGEEPVATTADRARAANAGYGDVGNDGYISFTPEDVMLGKKTGPYGMAKDPTVPMGYLAANDLWHGRAMGYAPDPGQSAFDRAFQPTEHAFLTGENVLATQRAIDQGTLPPGSTPANMQEVVWVEARKQDWLAKERARFQAGKRKSEPTEQEALDYALEGIDTAVRRNTAAVSREFTPGGGLGELEQIGADPALNARFSADMAAAGGNPKNSVFSALQMYQRPTVEGVGYWNDPVLGLQQNPVFTDRPLVDLSPEMVGGKPGGVAMDPLTRDALMLSGRLHGIENVQHGVGANMFIPGNSSHKASQLNGLYVGPEGRQQAMDQALAEGLDVVDNGDGGIVITSFGDDAPGKVKAFSKKVGGKLGRFDANYAASGLSDDSGAALAQGTGEATRQLLDASAAIPGFDQRLAASTYPAEVAARNDVRRRYAEELATSLRPDVQRLRDLLASGGTQAVRDYVRANGLAGLPAWAGVMLGGAALTSMMLQDPAQQAQPAL